jgi:hypothetical protein
MDLIAFLRFSQWRRARSVAKDTLITQKTVILCNQRDQGNGIYTEMAVFV